MPNPMEKIAAEGAGVAKAAGARIKGLYGVFNTLAKEHGEASALLSRAEKADDAAKQKDLWKKLRPELLSHEEGESSEVYPTLQQYEIMQAAVAEHESEVQQLEEAITKVDAASYGTVEWTRSIEALHLLVKQHAEKEEQEFFPRATEVVDKDMAAAIDRRFKAVKKSVMDKLGVE